MLQQMAAVAELEAGLISTLAAAKARGAYFLRRAPPAVESVLSTNGSRAPALGLPGDNLEDFR